MRGRQPRPDRSQLPHAGSSGLVRSPWTSYHPDPEGPMVSKWWERAHTLVRRATLFSFLVACFAAELLGSMGRTKDRASQMSQGLSYNAFLKVTAQLRLQYQELLNLQSSQQCVKETLKTLEPHAHATYSDASTVLLVAVSAQRSAKAQVRLQASQQSEGDGEDPSEPHCSPGSTCR